MQDCSTYDEKSPCVDNSCIWVGSSETEGICVDPNDPSLSCGIYDKETPCEEDVHNLGKIGAGTQDCETFFIDTSDDRSYIIEDCACRWEVDECVLGFLVGAGEYRGVRDIFNCTKAYGGLEECVDGVQNISWIAVWKDQAGGMGPVGIGELSGCTDGSEEISCGEPIVKLPGFGLFSMVASIFVIGMYYFLFQKK